MYLSDGPTKLPTKQVCVRVCVCVWLWPDTEIYGWTVGGGRGKVHGAQQSTTVRTSNQQRQLPDLRTVLVIPSLPHPQVRWAGGWVGGQEEAVTHTRQVPARARHPHNVIRPIAVQPTNDSSVASLEGKR